MYFNYNDLILGVSSWSRDNKILIIGSWSNGKEIL